ncbi:hypothetical protein BDV26DRAFT_257857 [Aspergillus bertholletiae]|uniref:Uncharacterized protein n=1 Tax=Aspergillus bertholletiae TaxID=1226010 RepID=A0A5N7BEJ4_9EURO|nr:hypothetical protein BDV26DRAFT_257857 [Aspergillus bertholletiae]
MFEIDVQQVLMQLEEWYVKLDPTSRSDCRTTKLEQWSLNNDSEQPFHIKLPSKVPSLQVR